MATNAKKRVTYGKKIKDQSNSISELYTLAGIKNAPLSSTMSFSVAGGSSTPSGIETQERLKTSGDSMVGAIAYYPKIATISSGAIDVIRSDTLGDLTDDYTTYLIVTPVGVADDLDTISNPSNAGQLIHLEANSTGTITLKHNTGNIFIPSESDHTISAGGFATLIYDVAIHTDKWVLVSSSEAGGGSWVGTATSDLDMDTYDITDVCRIEFNQGGDTIDDSVAGIDSSSDKIRFNVPSGDHFHFTVDGDDEVKIDGTDFGIWGYLKFNSHTSGTNQPYQESDGYINIKIGASTRKLYFYL